MPKIKKQIQKEYNLHFQNVTFLLFLAYFWETIEHYIELSGFLPFIFSGEPWANRIIVDGVAILIGYWIAFQFRHIKFFGLRFLAIWILIISFAVISSGTWSHIYVESLHPWWMK